MQSDSNLSVPALSAERARELFSYDAETGVISRIKIAGMQGGPFHLGPISRKPRKDGYRSIGVDGKEYLYHRLAWLLFHGEWPPEDIDHVNGNPSDNRLQNLRKATRSENLFNRSVRSDNRTSYKGVELNKSGYRARISINGRMISLGRAATAEEASLLYQEAARKLHGEFYRTPDSNSI